MVVCVFENGKQRVTPLHRLIRSSLDLESRRYGTRLVEMVDGGSGIGDGGIGGGGGVTGVF